MRNMWMLWVFALVCGCSAADMGRGMGGGDGGGVDGSVPGPDGGTTPRPMGPLAMITGSVWAPGNAPGMVTPGEEIPIFNASIQVRTTRPEPIPNMVYCERCISAEGFTAQSGYRGEFSIPGITPGDYWLVIQKGQFRIERQISLAPGQTLDLDVTVTTLPSIHNPELGDWVPRIAIATGSYDSLEDVLGKMGIGSVDSSGSFSNGSAGSDRIDFYSNGGETYTPEYGTLADLVSDYGRLQQYHILFIPCSGSSNTDVLNQPAVLQNIRNYVAAGGKLYVTDWSGEWHDNVFPAQIELGSGILGSSVDTPASAYNAASGTWNTSLFGSADGDSYDSNNAEAVDPDLNAWLNGQMGPLASGGTGTFNPNNMSVVDNWNTIMNVNTVTIGVDDEGLEVFDEPRVFVIGGEETSLPKRPLTVTYEPVGCGRVLFSTYHTTHETHVGLVPQERILLYLIMEIGVCKEGPILI